MRGLLKRPKRRRMYTEKCCATSRLLNGRCG
jgi:hypothetical protein